MLRARLGCDLHQAQRLFQSTGGGRGGGDRTRRGASATALLQSRAQQSGTRAGVAERAWPLVRADCAVRGFLGIELANRRGDGPGSGRKFRDQQCNDPARFSQTSDDVQVSGRQFDRKSTASVVFTRTGCPLSR